MKKVLIALETLLLVAAIAFGVYTYMEKTKVIADRDTLLSQNAELQQSIAAIGPLTNVYTVKSQMIANTPVMAEDLVQMTIPASAVPVDAITDLNQIVYIDPISGARQFKYYKVTVNPQTMLTQDLFMNEDYTQPLYERDITLDWLPIGLKADDCIDIRFTYPDGTDLVVFSHKRVYMVLENTIKLKLTYSELLRLTSLQIENEFYSGLGVGVRVYAVAYIEPGLTKDTKAQILYPLSEGMAIFAQRDPNVKDKNEIINANLRSYLDNKMKVYIAEQIQDNDFGIYSTGGYVGNEQSGITTGKAKFEEMYKVLEDGDAIEQPTDLTGTGWDGEIINGGQYYHNPANATEEGTEGADGFGAIGGASDGFGAIGSDPMAGLQSQVNQSAEQLGGVGTQLQQDPGTMPTMETQDFQSQQPYVPETTQAAVQETQPVVQETQPTVQDTQPAVQETSSTTQETEAPTSAETKPAADSAGNEQSITPESKDAARISGNMFDQGGID